MAGRARSPATPTRRTPACSRSTRRSPPASSPTTRSALAPPKRSASKQRDRSPASQPTSCSRPMDRPDGLRHLRAPGDVGLGASGELLEEFRGEGFIAMHGIEQAGEGNIDHLVSGPTGVFMIESKAKG